MCLSNSLVVAGEMKNFRQLCNLTWISRWFYFFVKAMDGVLGNEDVASIDVHHIQTYSRFVDVLEAS